jgi:hypothetical protein
MSLKMKVIIIALGILFSFNVFSQLEPTVKKSHHKKITVPEVIPSEVRYVVIEITETEERKITKKTYSRMTVFISEKK